MTDLGMCGHEPPSGWNLPPGCFDGDIDREFGGERRCCGECRHCIDSGALGCLICAPRLRDAVAGLEGARRRSPGHILAAVEGAAVDGCGRCPEFEW